ncbi:hypothetical protein N1851_020076 [Merluccius polli]|uniref:Uncharacterized protein n=1 Tax=Merluccius polli TaxID=89951 RepID=A0AA47MLE6_MERPO|nr:hypothetical protein N1851_020076 [Merluccius polli]
MSPTAPINFHIPVAPPTAPFHVHVPVAPPVPETQLANSNPRLMSRGKKTVRCTHCGVTLNKNNLRLHIQRKHSTEVTNSRHLPSQCIDPVNGIYAVEKCFRRPCSVVHVQKKSGPQAALTCESDECATNYDFAARSGFQHFECLHLKSVQFCPWTDRHPAILDEDVLTKMVEERVFGEQTKTVWPGKQQQQWRSVLELTRESDCVLQQFQQHMALPLCETSMIMFAQEHSQMACVSGAQGALHNYTDTTPCTLRDTTSE